MFQNKKKIYIFTFLNNFNIKTKSHFLSFFKNEEKNNIDLTYLKFQKFISILEQKEKNTIGLYFNETFDTELFIKQLEMNKKSLFYIFPLYPQIHQNIKKIAAFFSKNIPPNYLDSFFWRKSYFNSPYFLKTYNNLIESYIRKNNISQKDLSILFLYEDNLSTLYFFEVESTCINIIKKFPLVYWDLYKIDESLDFYSKIVLKRKNLIICHISTLLSNTKEENRLKIIKKEFLNKIESVHILENIIDDENFSNEIFDIIDARNFITNDMLYKYKN